MLALHWHLLGGVRLAFAVTGKVGEVAPELAVNAAFREKHWIFMKPRFPTTCVNMAYKHV